MFDLTRDEFTNLRSHIGTSSWGGERYVPMAFTEQGVAMLSSVLNSKRAIQVNIQIIRTFTKLRHALLDNENLRKELEELKQRKKLALQQKKNAVHTVSEKKSSFKVTKCGLKETDIQKVVRQAEGIGT